MMESTFTVIVPLDGSPASEAALPVADRIAGPEGRVCLLHVVPPPERQAEEILRRYFPEADAGSSAAMGAHHELVETAMRWGGTPPHVSLEVRCGDPAEEILSAAAQSNAALVVMASHGRGAVGRWRYGSVADRVVRTATVPVMIVRQDADATPESGSQFTCVVIPYDGSEIAGQAIPTVIALARRLDLPVRVLRVVDVTKILAGSAVDLPLPPELYAEIETELRHDAQASVDAVAERLRAEGLTAEGAVFFGAVGQSILDTTGTGDLVVMTSHGRGGLRRWVLGSIAEKLIRLAEAPVVVVPAADR